jgi:hypothetical protein
MESTWRIAPSYTCAGQLSSELLGLGDYYCFEQTYDSGSCPRRSDRKTRKKIGENCVPREVGAQRSQCESRLAVALAGNRRLPSRRFTVSGSVWLPPLSPRVRSFQPISPESRLPRAHATTSEFCYPSH